jgi:oligopeptide/dipeptide ABC transporter ATP-binding protein
VTGVQTCALPISHRVAVVYAGRVVEEAEVRSLFHTPLHPYTRGLLASMPHLGEDGGSEERLQAIPGSVPSPLDRPPGCSFAPRCAHTTEACLAAEPALETVGPNHAVRCHRSGEFR